MEIYKNSRLCGFKTPASSKMEFFVTTERLVAIDFVKRAPSLSQGILDPSLKSIDKLRWR